MRILVLLTDAYGGRGGIAQHNRHLLEALCSAAGVTEVVALPRVVVEDVGGLPERLTYRAEVAGTKLRYVLALVRETMRRGRFDLVVCGHLNLLPLSVIARLRYCVQLVQIVHGIEAWNDPGANKRILVRFVDRLVSVSDFTRRKVQAWAHLPDKRTVLIPNAVDLSAFTPGPKRSDLVERYGIAGKKVILMLSRLSASERYKGHDEVFEVLPALVARNPDVVCLVAGDGDDRPRLEGKARALGLAENVVFAGYVPEADKADHYRLANMFAMPGRGEGFGIVYLEALACGVPVIASSADASCEAVLGGRLGAVVDPTDASALAATLTHLLAIHNSTPSGVRDEAGLDTFSVRTFRNRWHNMIGSFVDA